MEEGEDEPVALREMFLDEFFFVRCGELSCRGTEGWAVEIGTSEPPQPVLGGPSSGWGWSGADQKKWLRVRPGMFASGWRQDRARGRGDTETSGQA